MAKQLLIERLPFIVEPSLVRESISQNGGRLVVSGLLQRANVKNQNGRIYPKEILEREVERYMNEEVANRRSVGELDHPDRSVVEYKNVSHLILDTWWEGDDLYGKAEILNTPSGNILKELFNANVGVMISSRGLGSVKQIYESDDTGEETVEVQDDFSLLCWDFVSNGSVHGSYMKPHTEGKLTEGKQQTLQSKYSNANKLVRDIICELSGVCCIEQ